MTRPTRRALVVALCVTALGVTACGSEPPEDRYAADWDAICGDVKGALQEFRTGLVTAARAAPDAGDDAAHEPLDAAAASALLQRPAGRLGRALDAPLRRARELEPPERWRRWHEQAVERFATQVAVVDAGVRRVADGDAEQLASLAIGGFGPASLQAPPDLRDRTPICVGLR